MNEDANPYRRLPAIESLLRHPAAAALCAEHGRATVNPAVRCVLAQERQRIAAGGSAAPSPERLLAAAAGIAWECQPGLRRVINATGIVLHTNLGRAPLGAEVMDAVAAVAAGYCNLEFDLASGTRGVRGGSLEPLLCALTGAAAGLAVNNGAAAILLALSAHAAGGEVVVSRGELIEIGGGFRIPDVVRQGGARLVEVGATNKTRLDDYRAAIGPDTRVLLKVHQSNFRMVGFTAETGIAELASLAREHGLLLVADLGSGLLAPLPGTAEPTLRDALAAGADLVTCSGDKLLGGPQAGVVAGTRAAIEPLRRHPLMRALRLDKMALAALEATLRLHRDRPDRVPVNRMLGQAPEATAARAVRLRALVGQGVVEPSDGFAGGGSLPDERLASHVLALEPAIGAEAAARLLRGGRPAVVGRISRERLLLDLLTVGDDEVDALAGALRAVLA
ncbi:MAG: L-seryl-tRNA(Sec) selenium transferase [Novosphingobium sp.]